MSDHIQIVPMDEYNRALLNNVHPPEWENPTPADRYNLVVIGAGTAGLVTAAGAAGLGAKVALVERHLMGGDCLNFGCVPSKAIISAARSAAGMRRVQELGIAIREQALIDPGAAGFGAAGSGAVSFGAVMERMRRLRARISPNDSAVRFRELGVDVFFGNAEFVDSETIAVNNTKLRFRKAVIATGARASAPQIPGLSSINYLTNETLFSLTDLPGTLAIVGAGPIGCEMAQSFARLGSTVYLIESESGILPREDRDAAAIIEASLRHDGVEILCGARNLQFTHDTGTRFRVECREQVIDKTVDHVLISAGRTPNIEGLNLNKVAVQFNRKGIVVNERMQTTNPVIYAAGDVCSPYQFTHAADFMARIVIQNSLFKGRKKASSLLIPWCTYTSPEIAHVGLSEKEAIEKNIQIQTFVQPFHDVDRAILDGDDNGFVRIHVRKQTDQIVGATIVATHAGDMISEITLAMTNGIGLRRIASTIHPYPTQADAIRRIGDQYNRTRLTPFVRSLFQRWLRWTR